MKERKSFNFYRSYWEIAQELPKEARCEFYDALMKRQFTGEETELKGMAKFAYISQKHSIDRQIQGFIDKTDKVPTEHPTEGGSQGGKQAPTEEPSLQLERNNIEGIISNEEIKPKRDWESFIKTWNRLTERNIRVVTDKAKRQIEKILKTYTQAEFWATVENCKSDPYHQENPQYLTPEFISREDKFQKYYQKKQVTLRKDWFHTPNLPPEEWALLTPEQQKNKKLNDIRNGY